MKKGILGVLMAAVAALFLVEVSMETVFTRTRIQQTMAYSDVEAADETAPEVLTVLVMGEEPERLQYLLLCGICGDGSVGLVSVAPETLLRCAGDGQLRTAAELCCADGPKGVLGENHRQSFACQTVMLNAVAHIVFQLIRQIEDLKDILTGEIQKLQ